MNFFISCVYINTLNGIGIKRKKKILKNHHDDTNMVNILQNNRHIYIILIL